MFLLVLELVRLGTQRLDELAGLSASGASTPSLATAKSTGDQVYMALKQRIESCESELEQQAYGESDAKLGEWTERIRVLRKDIRAATVLTEEQREKLLAGALSLRVDLMSLQRETSPTHKRGRGKVATVADASPPQQQPDRSQNASARDDAATGQTG